MRGLKWFELQGGRREGIKDLAITSEK